MEFTDTYGMRALVTFVLCIGIGCLTTRIAIIAEKHKGKFFGASPVCAELLVWIVWLFVVAFPFVFLIPIVAAAGKEINMPNLPADSVGLIAYCLTVSFWGGRMHRENQAAMVRKLNGRE